MIKKKKKERRKDKKRKRRKTWAQIGYWRIRAKGGTAIRWSHNMKRQAGLGPRLWDQSCQCHLFAIPCDFCISQPFCMKMNHKGHQNTRFYWQDRLMLWFILSLWASLLLQGPWVGISSIRLWRSFSMSQSFSCECSLYMLESSVNPAEYTAQVEANVFNQ